MNIDKEEIMKTAQGHDENIVIKEMRIIIEMLEKVKRKIDEFT